MTTATPLDRLASLSSQRTARTDRLHEATQALLSILERGDTRWLRGACVRVDGYALRRTSGHTNVGGYSGWELECGRGDDSTGCDLDMPLDGEGYRHGDFNSAWRGPSREDLVAFAARASRFVEALIKRETDAIAALDVATSQIAAARAEVQS